MKTILRPALWATMFIALFCGAQNHLALTQCPSPPPYSPLLYMVMLSTAISVHKCFLSFPKIGYIDSNGNVVRVQVNLPITFTFLEKQE